MLLGEVETVVTGAVTVEVTITCFDACGEVPPVPVQVTLYVVVEDGETDTVPEVAFPVEKPVPVQEVAFVELQVSAEELP